MSSTRVSRRRLPFPLPGGKALALTLTVFSALGAGSSLAQTVDCTYTYGGEVKHLRAQPTTSPYTVAPIAVGSFFLFRIVFEKTPVDQAAIKLYVHASDDSSPKPLHQATYAWPVKVAAHSRYGFTGLQQVYEPLLDGELEYWCQMQEDK